VDFAKRLRLDSSEREWDDNEPNVLGAVDQDTTGRKRFLNSQDDPMSAPKRTRSENREDSLVNTYLEQNRLLHSLHVQRILRQRPEVAQPAASPSGGAVLGSADPAECGVVNRALRALHFREV